VVAPQTNIVFASIDGGRTEALLAHLARRAVLATGLIGLRFVTHLDVDAVGIERAVDAVREFVTA
jgi:threonine aldolase